MKTPRILALPAVAAASLLALTGCIQLPPIAGSSTSQSPTDGSTAGEDLAGSTWSGAMGTTSMDFALNPDGTVDIMSWDGGDGFDEPGDTWTGDSANLTLVITNLSSAGGDRFDLSLTGSAIEGAMTLTGDGPDGTVTLTATQG